VLDCQEGVPAERPELGGTVGGLRGQGLLPRPERTGGQRRYRDETVRRLEVIDIAKRADFSLYEIRILLDTSDAGEPSHPELRALAESKLPEVEALIARAEATRGWLEMARECSCSSLELCALCERRG
jgi:MerR family redox-sensitive transcriptional activator SoxR